MPHFVHWVSELQECRGLVLRSPLPARCSKLTKIVRRFGVQGLRLSPANAVRTDSGAINGSGVSISDRSLVFGQGPAHWQGAFEISGTQLITGLDVPTELRGGLVAIGNFDGVHRGHRRMLSVLTSAAQARGIPSLVMTFDPHPIAILRPGQAPPPLTTPARRFELLSETSPTAVISYATDMALLQMPPRVFFDEILRGRLQAAGFVEGPNFQFGKDRAGTVDVLRDYCDSTGLSLDVVPVVELEGRVISSSIIRRLLRDGDVKTANASLGSTYQVTGTVVQGAMRGRTIGIPTANLAGISTVLPGNGVYACRVSVGDRPYAAGVNIGPNPTFGDAAQKVEAHLLDFADDLYGQTLKLHFIDRLRDVRAFSGKEDLLSQLHQDFEAVRRLVSVGIPAASVDGCADWSRGPLPG